MRTVPCLAALVIAAAAVAACGQASPGITAGSPAATACAAHRPPGGAGPTVMVTVSDNGRSLCVRPGTGVFVILRGTLDRRWAPVHASSGVLVPRPNGRLALRSGVTGGYFVAARPGTVVLSSARPACGGETGLDCAAPQVFRATVVVRR